MSVSTHFANQDEGQLVTPFCPLIQVSGPLGLCQLLESAILNKINFASLIATNAAIHRLLAPKSLLFEFGLRRAQGHNAVTASKYAVLGGFDYTSNCVAAKLHKLPLTASMSHSFVTSFASFNEVERQVPSNVLEKTRQIREKIRSFLQAKTDSEDWRIGCFSLFSSCFPAFVKKICLSHRHVPLTRFRVSQLFSCKIYV